MVEAFQCTLVVHRGQRGKPGEKGIEHRGDENIQTSPENTGHGVVAEHLQTQQFAEDHLIHLGQDDRREPKAFHPGRESPYVSNEPEIQVGGSMTRRQTPPHQECDNHDMNGADEDLPGKKRRNRRRDAPENQHGTAAAHRRHGNCYEV